MHCKDKEEGKEKTVQVNGCLFEPRMADLYRNGVLVVVTRTDLETS